MDVEFIKIVVYLMYYSTFYLRIYITLNLITAPLLL